MGLYEYSNLILTDRLQLVWEQGTFLANIKTYTHGLNLYALFDFYVEVTVTYKSNETVITDATAFQKGYRLTKYLEQIDLSEWIENR